MVDAHSFLEEAASALDLAAYLGQISQLERAAMFFDEGLKVKSMKMQGVGFDLEVSLWEGISLPDEVFKCLVQFAYKDLIVKPSDSSKISFPTVDAV